MRFFLTLRTTLTENGIRSAIAVVIVLVALSTTMRSAQESSFEVASVNVIAKADADQSGWQTIRPALVAIHAMPIRRFLPVASGVPGDLATVKFDFSRVSRHLIDRTYFDIQ